MMNEGQNPRRRRASAAAPDFDRALNLRDLLSRPEASVDSDLEDAESDSGSPGKEPGPMGAQDLVRRLIIDFRLFCKGNRPDEQIEVLGRMQQQVKAFRSLLANSDLVLWAKFSGVLSTLLFATAQKPGFPTFSAFRTMADALDLLRTVVTSGSGWRGSDSAPLTVLVAADDATTRRALHLALQNQGMTVTDCRGADDAMLQMRDNPFDVLLLDTELAEMEDFVLPAKLRRLPFHATTPILLLTSQPDFAAQFEWVLDDGCDFIAKPIVASEAAVKVFAFGLKFRLDPGRAKKGPVKTKALPAPPKPAPSVVVSPPVAVDAAASESHAQAQAARELAEKEQRRVKAEERAAQIALAQAAKELAEKEERRVKAEERAAQLAQARARLEEQLVARALQFQEVQAQAADLEKTRQALDTELGKSSRRESGLKQQCQALEHQLESLNQSLARLGQDLAQESERRLLAEQQASQLTQHLDEASHAENTTRQQLGQMARDHAKEVARLQSSLQKEVRARELAEQAVIEVESLQRNLERLGQDLAQEGERRLAAECQASQLTRRLDEATRAESAARLEFGQLARDHAKEVARLQSSLQKEVRAREQAEQAAAELTAEQNRMEKQLADGWLQAQQALERSAALQKAQKVIQSELRGALERHGQIQQQLAALDEPLKALGEIIRPEK